MTKPDSATLATAEIPLERDLFFRTLLRNLAGTLEDVVGVEAAEGYVSIVGGEMGRWIDGQYRRALGRQSLTREEVAQVCVDLKARIGGGFHVISQDDEKIVFGNTACPFGDRVRDRPSLCMMTSNVFGRISADNLGYARVRLDETIAQGAPGCRVVVFLKPDDGTDPDARDYFRSPDTTAADT